MESSRGSDTDTSETILVIRTNKDRIVQFCKIYWKTLVIVLTPLALLPVYFIQEKNAYKCFYIFLVSTVYLLTDVLHPAVVSLIPIAVSIADADGGSMVGEIYLKNCMLNCLGMMVMIVAIEFSGLHRRVAIKLLLWFGCSHYRLSFLLFFGCMFISLWVSNTMACGLMMPIVKAVLMELEKMGILEMYHTLGKSRQNSIRHEQVMLRPTDFTTFYFLGLAYSSAIGGMATLIGSQTNIIFREYCASIFPFGTKIEYPNFLLLNLPGVLLMELSVYVWMNFYFMGMFRGQSEIALEIGISEEESQYIHTLLSTRYVQLGRISFHEAVLIVMLVSVFVLQATRGLVHSYISVPSYTVLAVVLLFIIPKRPDFIRFFMKNTPPNQLLPVAPTKACLNWRSVRSHINWSVLFIVAGSYTMINSLNASNMTGEFEKFLYRFKNWPASAQALIVIIFSKIMTEFASNSCVANVLLPCVARVSISSEIHPHYLMLASTLASSVPFHLVTGTAANAMVAAYAQIPPWKMMHAGLGPSIITIFIIWTTVVLWSKAIWTTINVYPKWAYDNKFNISRMY